MTWLQPATAGERFAVEGKVLDGEGNPVPDAVIEIWQADSNGEYNCAAGEAVNAPSTAFTGFGRIPMDDDGKFRFTTIRPGPVPGPGGVMQAPHLAVRVMMRGLLKGLVTRMYFPTEAVVRIRFFNLYRSNARKHWSQLLMQAARQRCSGTSNFKGSTRQCFSIVSGTQIAMTLFDRLFYSGPMLAVFSDQNRLQRMLDFEAALASVEAELGLIPKDASKTISAACKIDILDIATLVEDAERAGNLAIPLVKQLSQVAGKSNSDAARYVHWGATSQDVIDTGFVLQMREALSLVDSQLQDLNAELATLAKRHAATVMPGRTWLQHAVPITFGWKAAGWLDAALRHQARLQQIRPRALTLQLGGAAEPWPRLEQMARLSAVSLRDSGLGPSGHQLAQLAGSHR